MPHDDPTLLFTNAGMNQFKDVFLGTGTRPYKRAANTQKCIRAGGKHNDLDDVGKDTYHHTFFEMLGNWSLRRLLQEGSDRAGRGSCSPRSGSSTRARLHATVFEGDPSEGCAPDDEAAELWQTRDRHRPDAHPLGQQEGQLLGDGRDRPVRPVHRDPLSTARPDKTGGKLVNAGTPDVIEIWNLVFIQFNRDADSKLTPLPAKHVDTGMGFERVTAVLQGKASNYDTDVFTPIFEAIQQGDRAATYGGKLDDLKDTGLSRDRRPHSHADVRDHRRGACRATRSAATCCAASSAARSASASSTSARRSRSSTSWCRPSSKQMGGAFPELKANPEQGGEDHPRGRGRSFIRTLRPRHEAISRRRSSDGKRTGETIISGEDAFDLHTTYGFSIDITEQMAAEVGHDGRSSTATSG